MLALLFWRSTLNVFSMIGLVMLMGLVTKNAILLVDFANQARKAGATVADALLQAGLIRMRPIMMTTAAMVFGMLPLALALNDGGEIQAPMGRAIIGGVITSTLLTLVVVPVLYSYLVSAGRPPGRRPQRGRRRRLAAPARGRRTRRWGRVPAAAVLLSAILGHVVTVGAAAHQQLLVERGDIRRLALHPAGLRVDDVVFDPAAGCRCVGAHASRTKRSPSMPGTSCTGRPSICGLVPCTR